MYYEINISYRGTHFFATAERSITDLATLIRMFNVLDAKFPETEDYSLSVCYTPEVSFGCSTKALREAIPEGTTAVGKLFERSYP